MYLSERGLKTDSKHSLPDLVLDAFGYKADVPLGVFAVNSGSK